MEKISGVIGASPRLKSVDLQNSPPVRPGAPSFGQPVGEVTLARRKDLTTAQKANILREQMMDDQKRLRELRTVENMSGEFFMNKIERQDSPEVGHEVHIELASPGSIPNAEPSEAKESSDSSEGSFQALDPEEMKYTPKGYYLDRSA